MKPTIDGTEFGSITIAGRRFEHDVVIRLDGAVEKRKKKLSKAIYGSSHTVSLDEAMHIFQEGARRLVVGCGQHGVLRLSKEAAEFFESHACVVEALPTPEAIRIWNDSDPPVIGMFHVTC